MAPEHQAFIEEAFRRNRALFGDAQMKDKTATPAPTPSLPPGGTFVYVPGGSSSAGQFPTSSSSDFSALAHRDVPGMMTGGEHGGGLYPPVGPEGAMITPAGGEPGIAPITGQPPSPVTFNKAIHQLQQMGVNNPGHTLQLQEQLIKAGYLNPDDTSFVPGAVSAGDATEYAYANLLQDAITTHKNYQAILDARVTNPHNTTGQAFWQKFLQNKAAASGPVTTTQTSSDVQLTSAPDATSIAESKFEELLGRKPTQAQAEAFYGALTAYERAHPATSSTTTTTNPNGNSDSSTVTHEGITSSGAAQLAENQLYSQHGREVAKTQGQQIYDLFASLLGGNVDTSALGGPG